MEISSLPFIELATDDRHSLVKLTAQPVDAATDAVLEYEAELRLPGFVARQPIWLEPDEVEDFVAGLERLRQGQAERVRLPGRPGGTLELEIEAENGWFRVRAAMRSPAGREHPAALSGTFMVKRHGLTAFWRGVERAAQRMAGPLPAVSFEGDGSCLRILATGEFESTHLPAVRTWVEARLDGDCAPGMLMTGCQVCWIETDDLERLLAALEGRDTGETRIGAMSPEELSLRFTPPSTLWVEIGALSHHAGVRVQRQVAGTFELEGDRTALCVSLRALARLPFGGQRPPPLLGGLEPAPAPPERPMPASVPPERPMSAPAPPERPLPAAWSAVGLLHVETGERFRLPRGTRALIGRVPPADLIVRDPLISRVHAWIDLEGEAPLLSDAESTSGTWLNGERIAGPVVLRDGDQLCLGGATLRVSPEGG